MVEPIETYIRRLKAEIAEVEWNGGNAALLYRELSQAVQAKADGAQWHISF